jgi:hypothetical protein
MRMVRVGSAPLRFLSLSAMLQSSYVREKAMLLLMVRVSSGFIGILPFIFRMSPVFHLTIMVPPVDSNT